MADLNKDNVYETVKVEPQKRKTPLAAIIFAVVCIIALIIAIIMLIYLMARVDEVDKVRF